MDLYLWNIGLAQALLHDIALFEVALRNAYDRCLVEFWDGDWMRDEESPLRRPLMRTNRRGQTRDQNWINRKAIDRLSAEGRSHDWVVSNLTLGFWIHMTDRSHERVLWIPCLHRVWPQGSSRVEIARMVSTLNRARNRAVHHEHLFNPASDGCSPAHASEFMAAMFPALVPREFCHAYPEIRPTETTAFLNEHPAPIEVHL